MNNNMTALVSCFARAYHSKNYKFRIFNDYLASKILSKEEYETISLNMQQGISFFNPDFKGTKEEALRYIVDNQLSPTVLARSIFLETELKNEIKLGLKQYLIFASGYDTSAYRLNHKLIIYELDKKEVINDKLKRLKLANINHQNINYLSCDFTYKNWMKIILNSNYDKNKKSFCSLLGISYYLNKDDFSNMISSISNLLSEGSAILFDYPTINESKEDIINQKLASEANEEMKAKYTFKDIMNLADKNSLLVYKNLDHNDINKYYFYNYNTLNPNHNISAKTGVNYCLLIKK